MSNRSIRAVLQPRNDDAAFVTFLTAQNTFRSAKAVADLLIQKDIAEGPLDALYALHDLLVRVETELEAVELAFDESATSGRCA